MSYKEYNVKVYANGNNFWYQNGKYHRVDGPAVEWNSGTSYWFLEGVQYTEEEFNAKMNPVKEMTVQEISELLGFEVKIVK